MFKNPRTTLLDDWLIKEIITIIELEQQLERHQNDNNDFQVHAPWQKPNSFNPFPVIE